MDTESPSDTPTETPGISQSKAGEPGPQGPANQPAPELQDPDAGFVPTTLAELRKVVWPTRQQLFSESVAVILMVGLSAAAIAAVDRFYGWSAIQVFR